MGDHKESGLCVIWQEKNEMHWLFDGVDALVEELNAVSATTNGPCNPIFRTAVVTGMADIFITIGSWNTGTLVELKDSVKKQVLLRRWVKISDQAYASIKAAII